MVNFVEAAQCDRRIIFLPQTHAIDRETSGSTAKNEPLKVAASQLAIAKYIDTNPQLPVFSEQTVSQTDLPGREYRESENVVDISGAMEVVRVFREKAFDAQPVATQSEILKSRVRRIVVRENGVHVEILGRSPERSVLWSQNPDQTAPTVTPVAGSRSGVLTVSKLVEAVQTSTNQST